MRHGADHRNRARGAAPREPRSFTAPAAARFVRADHIPAGYSPWRHMALTLTDRRRHRHRRGPAGPRARPIDWVLMPLFFVVANFMEWAVHRFPMHRPLQPRIMYQNHAQLHHIAFTDANMPITHGARAGPRDDALVHDARAVRGGVAGDVVAGLLRGPGLAGVFVLGAVAYFLTYEVCTPSTT